MKRTLLSGFLGGIAMFVWASIAHVALPLGFTGMSEIPNEEAVLTAMHNTMGATAGMYIYPGVGAGGMANYDQKLASSPSGLVIYHPPGVKSLTPGQMIAEFLTETLEAIFAVYLLTLTRISTFAGRVGFITMVGVVASMGTNISYWNWYGFPGSYTAVYMMIQIVEFLVAGLVAAAMLRKSAPDKPANFSHAA